MQAEKESILDRATGHAKKGETKLRRTDPLTGVSPTG